MVIKYHIPSLLLSFHIKCILLGYWGFVGGEWRLVLFLDLLYKERRDVLLFISSLHLTKKISLYCILSPKAQMVILVRNRSNDWVSYFEVSIEELGRIKK